MHWCIAYRPTSFSGVFLVSAVPRIPVFSSGHGVFRGNRDRTRLGPLTAHVPTALASRKNLFLRRCVPLNYFIVAGMATRMLWSKEVNGIVLNTGCKLWLAELSIWDLHISRSYCWNGWSSWPTLISVLAWIFHASTSCFFAFMPLETCATGIGWIPTGLWKHRMDTL